MPTPDLVASTVLVSSAALMNDPNQTQYTNAALLPYLRIAMQELQEFYELHSIPVTQRVSAVINMPAGTIEVGFDPTVPTLPDNLVEIVQLWESNEGQNQWIPMTKQSFLPHYLEGAEVGYFIYWVWEDNKIKVLPSNNDNDIKIDYIAQLFNDVIDEDTQIGVINAKTFLEFRTAGLASEFIERNQTSALSLNGNAGVALERATGIAVKGKQAINTRRRPFRSAYKRGRYIT